MKKILKAVVYLGVLVSLLGGTLVGAAPSFAQEHNPESIIRWDEDWPTFFDPAVGTDYSDLMTMVNIHDGLVFPNDDGTIRPHIAKEWTVSDDGLTWTFTLRDDVKFHTGEMLKASDVVFSFNRLTTIGEGLSYLFQKKDETGKVVEGIETVTALDDHTVEFKLARPFGPFLQTLVRLYIVSEKAIMENIDKTSTMYGEFGDYGKNWYLTHDAGTGPYKVIDVKMEEFVLTEKFDDYFLGWEENSPDFFKMFAAPGEVATLTLMKNKEQEISSEMLTKEGFEALDKLPNVEVVTYFVGINLQIMLNNQKPPTDDVHFRRAISYALDYDAVTQIWPTYKVARGPVPFDLPGHNPNVRQYTRDLDKAKEELALSKYAGQENIPFTLSWCAEVPDEEKLALLFQANLAEIGVDVEIFKKPFGSMIDDAQTPESTPNGSIVYVSAPYAEAIGMLKVRYHSGSMGTPDQMEWFGNPEFDAKIDDAIATVDTEERFAKAAELQAEIAELAPTIFVADQGQQRGVQDYVYWPTAEKAKKGEPISTLMGYFTYVRDMKVFPDKK